MMKVCSCRKLCYLLVMLSWGSAGYTQDATRKILKKEPVEYPKTLKMMHIGGTVRLNAVVRPDGSVKDTEVVGGSAALAESAQKSVIHWKFAPGNAETTVQVVVHFDPAAKTED